jgi:hypothetical protein
VIEDDPVTDGRCFDIDGSEEREWRTPSCRVSGNAVSF